MNQPSVEPNMENVIPVAIGSSYNAYGVIRSFAEEGIRSILISDKNKNFVQYSKHLLQHVVMTDVNHDEDAFIREMIELGRKISPKRGILFPTHDEQLLAIARHARELEAYFEIPFSDYDTCRCMMDKAKFRAACEACGIPTIKEKLVNTPEDALACTKTIRLPIIVKANSWNYDMVRLLGKKTEICYTVAEYEQFVSFYYSNLPNGELLVQEYIEDSDQDMPNVNCFSDRSGKMCCVFVSEKIRQYPPRTGTSTATRAVDPQDPKYRDVIDYTQRLLSAFKFYGLSGTEYKYDPKEDCYKIIETNIRSEFPNYLQTLVGQNMPYQLYRHHLGQSVTIPYYPTRKTATCFVPVNDRLYFLHLNKYNHPEFVLTRKQLKKTLTAPKTGYGITFRDLKPFLYAYFSATVKGVNAYIRFKHKIPTNISTKDYFMKRRKTRKSV